MTDLNTALQKALAGDIEGSKAILLSMADRPEAQFNLGWHAMREGCFHEGMNKMIAGRWLNAFGSAPLATDRPIWKDEDLHGRKILLRGEGGFGDEIINVRFARDFRERGAYVTVSCARSLMPLFRTLPYVDALVESSHAEAADFDFWIPAMSAPLVLGYEYDDFDGKPYIPKPEGVSFCPEGLKIGLRWSGNPKFEHEQHRKFPVELMHGLCNVKNAAFYSLQRDNETGELPQNLIDLEPVLTDWLATARVIAGLDLVITSCTSIAHLSAAMGVPTWVIVPILPYYVWALPGETSPWYGSVRLFRQEKYGCWEAPFKEVSKRLEEMSCSFTVL